MVKKKIVIELCIPNAKSRGEAMALAATAHGVTSTAVAEDRLEVVGENIDAACLALRLRKKLRCSAKILTMEEVKDKKKEEEKKEEEEKKKKEAEAKKKQEEEQKKALEAWQRAGYPYYPHPPPPQTVRYCYDEPQAGCHIM